MQVQQTQPRTWMSSKQETSGRLGIFMPQISRDENVENNNKTRDKKLVYNNKKAATWQLRHASRARHSLDERRTRSTDAVPNDNKASASCDDNNEDKNYQLHFDKKFEGRLCCCGSLRKTDHRRPSRVKRAKRKRRFLHFWTTISDFVETVLMGLDSMDGAVLKGPDDVTNPFDFNLWRSALVETLGIEKLETVLYETSTNIELRISIKLSSLTA